MDEHWGHKTPTNGEKPKVFGFDFYAFARVQRVGDDDRYPHIVERCVLWPASSDEADSTLTLIEGMPAEGYPIKTLIVDRAWSYLKPERWALPVRALDIDQVVDLHENDYGVRDYDSLRVVAGWPHCPCMPDELIDIRRPPKLKLPDGTVLDELPDEQESESETVRKTREFVTAINARKAYACRRVQGPDPTGKERYECPAVAGQLRCPRRKLSMHMPATQVPTVENPPEGDDEAVPAICRHRSVTVPGTVTPKVRQKLYWGSVEWIRSFARRTHIEGVFGNLKNRNTENVSRGWVQVTGLPRTALAIAIATLAYNLRISRKWNAETGLSRDPLMQPDPPVYGWREVKPDEDTADSEVPAAA